MAVYRLGDDTPRIADSAWVADSAQVMGAVELAEHASVWFGAVLRGDTELIRVGKRSNVQDGTVIHADTGFPVTIGDDVTVGHQVMLHGCTVGDGSLILGRPAKVVRQLTAEQIANQRHGAEHYVENAQRFGSSLRKIA